MNVGTGLGKSSMILAQAGHLAKTSGGLVIILNSDINLLTRDFNHASAMLQDMKLQLDFQSIARMTNIAFFTDDKLAGAVLPKKFHLLVDEL